MPGLKDLHFYMILAANGRERGQPIALFADIFKAQQEYAKINPGCYLALSGNYTAFLVAYKVGADGELHELHELGRK